MTKLSDQEYEELKEFAVERHIITLDQMLTLALPTAFLIDQAIPKRGITMVSGAPGGGKSWLVYALAIAVADHGPWLGQPYADTDPTTEGVLVLNYDSPTGETARRFKQMLGGEKPEHPIWFHTLHSASPQEGMLTYPDENAQTQMIAIVQQLHPKLTVIDSCRESHTCDENDSKEMSDYMKFLKRLCQGEGTTIVNLHHTTKAGGTMRGSGAILASSDAEIGITGDDQEHTAFWHKHRGWKMSQDAESKRFVVVDEGQGDELVTRVVRL